MYCRYQPPIWQMRAVVLLWSLLWSLVALAQRTPLPFVTVDRGSHSGIGVRTLVAIKTEQEWEALWQRHRTAPSPEQKVPPIDFRQEAVVAVFAGEQRTGGYGIEVVKIEVDEEKRQLQVTFRDTRPPPDAMVPQVLTQPYHLVKLQQVDFPVVFISVSAPADR